MGVTQLHGVVYVVCQASSTISRFDAKTHQPLTGINVVDLRDPWDIAACEHTSQLYVAGCPLYGDTEASIWRVSSDGEYTRRWWTKTLLDTFAPSALSVTSSRLLVTSRLGHQLMQLDAAGNQVRRVGLPDYREPLHAVESPTETFIISHSNTELKQRQLSEVNTEGQVLRHFSGSLGWPPHTAVDSQGNIFVPAEDNRRILLLDAQLTLRRVIIDKHQLNSKPPQRLCYNEQSGQLLVGLYDRIMVFDVLQR